MWRRSRDVVWAAHAGDDYHKQGVGYRTMPAPQMNFHEQVWQHEMAADAAGLVPVALVNDRLGLAFEVETRKDQFPCQFEWQNLQAGPICARARALDQPCARPSLCRATIAAN